MTDDQSLHIYKCFPSNCQTRNDFPLAENYYENVIVDKSIKIIGSGERCTIVDGQQLGSVFQIKSGVAAKLSGMTIQYGSGTPTDLFGSTYLAGGGIWNEGTLTLDRAKVSNNQAVLGSGIYNRGALTLIGFSITQNTVTSTDTGGGW